MVSPLVGVRLSELRRHQSKPAGGPRNRVDPLRGRFARCARQSQDFVVPTGAFCAFPLSRGAGCGGSGDGTGWQEGHESVTRSSPWLIWKSRESWCRSADRASRSARRPSGCGPGGVTGGEGAGASD